MKRFFILFLLVISFCHCSYKKDSDPCDMGPYKLYIRVKENSPEYSSFFKQGDIDDNAIFLKIRDKREQHISSIKKGLFWVLWIYCTRHYVRWRYSSKGFFQR